MPPIPITPSSGLVASLRPAELPDGASPRTYDTDFLAGRVMQRSGLNNPFTYSGSSVGPSGGGSAEDAGGGSASWSSVGNVLLNTGVFASSTLPPPLSVSTVQVIVVVIGTHPFTTEISYGVVTFATAVPAGTSSTQYAFTGLSNYTALNGNTYAQVLAPH